MAPPPLDNQSAPTALPSGTQLPSGETVPFYESLHCWVCFRTYVPVAALACDPREATGTSSGQDVPYVEFWITNCSHLVCGPCARSLAEKAKDGSPPCPACHATDTSYQVFSNEPNSATEGLAEWLPMALEKTARAYSFQHKNLLHLLSYYRRQAQMQQRVFKGMVGELREARHTAKELARVQEENAALHRQLATLGESNRSLLPYQGEGNGGRRFNERAGAEGRDHARLDITVESLLPATDGTSESGPLARFYRPKPQLQVAVPKLVDQSSFETKEADSPPRKHPGSTMSQVRSRLSVFRAPSPHPAPIPQFRTSPVMRPTSRALTAAPTRHEGRVSAPGLEIGPARRGIRAMSLAPHRRSGKTPGPPPSELLNGSKPERRPRSAQRDRRTAPTLYGTLPLQPPRPPSPFRPPAPKPSTSRGTAIAQAGHTADRPRSGFRPASRLPFDRPYRPY